MIAFFSFALYLHTQFRYPKINPQMRKSNFLLYLYMPAGVEKQFNNPVKLWWITHKRMQMKSMNLHLHPHPHPLPRAELNAIAIRGHCNVIQRRVIDYYDALTWHGAIYTSV